MPTRCPEQNASIFVFCSKKFFFDISISGGCTGERKVTAVLTRCLKRMQAFSFFDPKNF